MWRSSAISIRSNGSIPSTSNCLYRRQIQPAQIQVPQVVSWRLHERFRWSSDQVLLLSCGVIAAPSGAVNNTLLGQGAGAIGLSRIIPPTAGGDRADALLILEYKGDNSTQLAPTQPPWSSKLSEVPSREADTRSYPRFDGQRHKRRFEIGLFFAEVFESDTLPINEPAKLE